MNAAHGPHDTHVAVGVAAVEAVVVVEVQGDAERLLRGLCPLEDLLRPVHPGIKSGWKIVIFRVKD